MMNTVRIIYKNKGLFLQEKADPLCLNWLGDKQILNEFEILDLLVSIFTQAIC